MAEPRTQQWLIQRGGETKVVYVSERYAKEERARLNQEGWVIKASTYADSPNYQQAFQKQIEKTEFGESGLEQSRQQHEAMRQQQIEQGIITPKEDVVSVVVGNQVIGVSSGVAQKIQQEVAPRQEHEIARQQQIEQGIITPAPVESRYLVVEPARRDLQDSTNLLPSLSPKTPPTIAKSSVMTTPMNASDISKSMGFGFNNVFTTSVRTTTGSKDTFAERELQKMMFAEASKEYSRMSIPQKAVAHYHTIFSSKGFEYIGALFTKTPAEQRVIEKLVQTKSEIRGDETTLELFGRGVKQSLSSPPVIFGGSVVIGAGIGAISSTSVGASVMSAPAVKVGMAGLGVYGVGSSGYDIYKDVKQGEVDRAIGKGVTLGASIFGGYIGYKEGQRIMEKPKLPEGDYTIKRADIDEAWTGKERFGQKIGKRTLKAELVESDVKKMSTKDIYGGKFEEMVVGVDDETISMARRYGEFKMKKISSPKEQLFKDDFWESSKYMGELDVYPRRGQSVSMTEIKFPTDIPLEIHKIAMAKAPKTTGVLRRESYLFKVTKTVDDVMTGFGRSLKTELTSGLPFGSVVKVSPTSKTMTIVGISGVFKRQTILQDLSDLYSGKYEEKQRASPMTGYATKTVQKVKIETPTVRVQKTEKWDSQKLVPAKYIEPYIEVYRYPKPSQTQKLPTPKEVVLLQQPRMEVAQQIREPTISTLPRTRQPDSMTSFIETDLARIEKEMTTPSRNMIVTPVRRELVTPFSPPRLDLITPQITTTRTPTKRRTPTPRLAPPMLDFGFDMPTPAVPPPSMSGFNIPLMPKMGEKPKQRKKGKQPKKYRPSLIGIIGDYQIDKEISGMLSGLEVRPIVMGGEKNGKKEKEEEITT